MIKNMKRTLAICLLLTMLVSLCVCNGNVKNVQTYEVQSKLYSQADIDSAIATIKSELAANKKYHPDLHPNDAAASERMNEINAAYDILSKPHSADSWERDSRSNTYEQKNPYGEQTEFVDFEEYKNRRNRQQRYNYTYTWNRMPVYIFKPSIFGTLLRWFIIFQILSSMFRLAFF